MDETPKQEGQPAPPPHLEPKRASPRAPRRTPRSVTRRRPAARRPFGPHPVERGSVSVPVRNALGGHDWCKLHPEDYALGMRHVWRLDQDGYVVTSVWDVERQVSTRLALHRVVARAPRDVIVDHVFQRKTDCRRRALRWASPAQNSANRRMSRVGRSSLFKGVTKHKSGKWQAQCKKGNTNFYLGLFDSEVDAALAYNRRAKELFGRFASVNRLPRTERKVA